MIGALAIKRRRKLQGDVPVPEPAPKSRHYACVYITGGASVITGIILLIPAIIESSNKLFIGSATLMGCGILFIIIACCLSGDPIDDSASDTEQEQQNGTGVKSDNNHHTQSNIVVPGTEEQVLKVMTTIQEQVRRTSIDSSSIPVQD